MALIAAIWNAKFHESTIWNTLVERSSKEQRFASRSAGVSSHLHNHHGTGAARLDKELTRKLAWRLDDFLLAAICHADDVVLVAVSVTAAEVTVTEVIAKLKEVGLTVGAQKNTLDRLPENDGQKHHGGWTGCVVGGSLGVCGIKGVLAREGKTCDRTQICSSQRVFGEVETCSEFFMALQNVALEHCKNHNVAGFSLEFECLDDMANVIGVKKPSWMELDQWWRLWHRTGHRWIEKGNMNVLTAIRERMLSWAGHVARMDYSEICTKA